MRIKLIKYPRPTQTEMLLYGTELKLGDDIDVSDAEADTLKQKWPGCFVDEVAKEPKAEAKQAKEYKNKAATTE
jgi:hypothetical protein